MAGNILTEIRERIMVITLNRPAARNALSPELMAELVEALDAAEEDKGIRVIVITGGRDFFSAGADIKHMSSRSALDMYRSSVGDLWVRVAKCTKPVIAAISGFAFGGGLELAMACDIIVCADDAKLGQPEIRLGIIPGAGGTQRLSRVIGKHKALEMILTGDPITSEEAYRLGLVNKVVPRGAVLDEALRMARTISERPPIAVRAAKEAVTRGLDMDLDNGLNLESRLFGLLFATSDAKEGLRAFIEKRQPVFRGE